MPNSPPTSPIDLPFLLEPDCLFRDGFLFPQWDPSLLLSPSASSSFLDSGDFWHLSDCPADSPACSSAAAADNHNSALIHGSGVTSPQGEWIRGNGSCEQQVKKSLDDEVVGSLEADDGLGKINGVSSSSGGGGRMWWSAAPQATGIMGSISVLTNNIDGAANNNNNNNNNVMNTKTDHHHHHHSFYYNYNSGSSYGSSYGSSWNDAAPSPPDVSSFAAAPSPKRQKTTTHDQTNGETIGILVETRIINLNDGYVWRKYGEKKIKNHEHTRSYFRCASSGCKIQKQIQRKSSNTIMFTYIGRHNHHVS